MLRLSASEYVMRLLTNALHKFRRCLRIGTLRPLWRLAAFRWRAWRCKKSGDWGQMASMSWSAICSGTAVPGIIERYDNRQEPLVSVIIPCFNYGAYVMEAVDSVLAQTWQNVEICVVDGGSTDTATLAVLNALDRPKTRVLHQPAPTLVGGNRNFGIASTQGQYICCLDADDRLKPSYLEKTVQLLESGRADVVSAGHHELGRPERIHLHMPFPLLEDLVLGNHALTCAVFPRALFERTGGFVDTGKGADHVAEDWRLWVHMAALGARFCNIPEPLLEYRIHGNSSLSRQPGVPPPWQQADAICEALEKILTPESFAASRQNASKQVFA